MVRTPSLMKRFALSAAICGGVMAGHHAIAQERGLLSDPAERGFNAAGAAAEDGPSQAQPNRGQSNPAQPGVRSQGQLDSQPPQPGLQAQPQGSIRGGIQSQPQVIQGQANSQQLGAQQQPGAQQPGAQQLGDQGRLQAGQGHHGVQLGIQVEPHDEGLKVVSVREDSVAKKAGIKEGDIIKRFNDKEVSDAQMLHSHVNQSQPGDQVELVVLREDEEETLMAKFEQNQDRYSAARPAPNDSIQAELDSLRSEIKQLREEMKALKDSRNDRSEAQSEEKAESEEARSEKTESADAESEQDNNE